MARFLIRDKALDDIQSIAQYIARDNLPAALHFCDAARLALDFLGSMPGAGPRLNPPPDLISDLQFWPICRFRNYLVLYEPLPDGVKIIRVIHGARDLITALSES